MTKPNPLTQMTPEEFERYLASFGVAKGQWRDVGDRKFEPSFIKAQKALLAKLRDALVASVEADAAEVARLKQDLAKLQYGGGS